MTMPQPAPSYHFSFGVHPRINLSLTHTPRSTPRPPRQTRCRASTSAFAMPNTGGPWKILCRQGASATAIHVIAFSQLGVLFRALIGEAFGGGCHERVPGGKLARWGACVTVDGTQGIGGAFFRDLPANVVGCFLMGLLSSAALLRERYVGAVGSKEKELAMMPDGHTLQSHTAAQVGLRTGFCGSLTTFASWQLQMVVMLVGGEATNLDSQWLAVMSGLLVGTQAAMASLVIGQHVGVALLNGHEQQTSRKATNAEIELPQLKQSAHEVSMEAVQPKAQEVETGVSRFSIAVLILFILGTGLAGVGATLLVEQVFWRKVCVAVIFGPVGALLRWQLGGLNGSLGGKYSWFPLGTWAANMTACAVAFLCHGLVTNSRILSTSESLLAFGVKVGFCGALSTVSTWAVEIQKVMSGVGDNYNGYTYIFISHLGALFLGLVAYGWAVWT